MPGLDFRKIEYRREVFLRFFEFHLRYRAHPGAVYYVIPYLRAHFGWSEEDAYWWAFLNGNTQHPVTSTILWDRFRSVDSDVREMRRFLDQEWKRLEFDADRRYWKVKLPEAVEQYQRVLDGRPQKEYFASMATSTDECANFDVVWTAVRRDFFGFGRLSAWSYLEYLRIVGLGIDPSTLFLGDRDGSKSHRNGLCKVLGRDDLDWHDSNPSFDGKYTDEQIAWLAREGEQLLLEARARIKEPARDVGYFTMESTLCCYKSWHRPNRRYPNVYNDMFHDRIRRAEAAWGRGAPIDLQVFWDARRASLPPLLRLEDQPGDCGLAPAKQNHYRLTGQVVMMHEFDPVFENNFGREATEETEPCQTVLF